MAISVLDLALHRGAKENEDGTISGGEIERVGLPFLGGCACCGATIAAYNAAPSKSGSLKCLDGCIDEDGWDSVESANVEIFGLVDAPNPFATIAATGDDAAQDMGKLALVFRCANEASDLWTGCRVLRALGYERNLTVYLSGPSFQPFVRDEEISTRALDTLKEHAETYLTGRT